MYISCFLFSLYRRYRLDYFWMLELWKLPSSFFYWMNLHIANFVRIRVYHPVWKNEKYHNKRLQKISAVKYMYKMHNFLTLYEPENDISQFTFFTQIWHFLNTFLTPFKCLLTQFRSSAVHEKFIRATWI